MLHLARVHEEGRQAWSRPDALFNLRRSRLRDSRTLGSVGAKAEWLSCPPIAWRLAVA